MVEGKDTVKLRVFFLFLSVVLIACKPLSPESLPSVQSQKSQQATSSAKGCVEEGVGNWCFSGMSGFPGGKVCGTREACIVMSARYMKDVTLCDEVLDEGSRNACVGNVAEGKKDPEVCNSLKDEVSREGCYLQYAQNMNDKSVCALMKNEALRTMCMNTPPPLPALQV